MRALAQRGYTILEVMLFIVISSGMFVLAMTSFSGRQQDVQFTQAVRELDAKLQDTINDVSTGFFSNDGRLSCTVTAPGRPTIDDASASVDQGTNDACVFVGKAVQFAPEDDNADTANESQLFIYNLVGRRLTATGELAESLEDAKPIAVSPTVAGEFADTTDKSELKYGLRVTRVAQDSPVADVGTIGFFGGFSRSIATTEFSDSQGIKSGPVPNTIIGQTQYSAVNEINRITDLNPPNGTDAFIDISSTRPIIICLADNSLSRRASITIGGEGRASTRVDFDNYNQTVCGS